MCIMDGGSTSYFIRVYHYGMKVPRRPASRHGVGGASLGEGGWRFLGGMRCPSARRCQAQAKLHRHLRACPFSSLPWV